MDSQSVQYEDNRESERSRQSRRSSGKRSERSLKAKSDRTSARVYSESVASDRARTRTRDPDRDRVSDGEKSSERYYSDEYENTSLSDRSRSLSPCSRSPSPSPRRAGRGNHVSSRRGLHRTGPLRAGSKQPRPGVGSHSKGSSPKELDVVTRRVLSARLLKINEQRNQLSELRLQLEELRQENRALRQLQLRQERALHKFEGTENEVGQLLQRHGGEVQALRERLRRTQERERACERRLRQAEEELRRCGAALQKLRRLADDRQLGERDDLARRLAQALERLQEDQRRIKELERSMELSSGSFQRQLTAERKKTHEVQDEVRSLREELERVTQKLKEKEKELNNKNLYANRMVRGTPRKEADIGAKRKGPGSEGSSRCSSKGVQTAEPHAPPEFPTPPPAAAHVPQHPRDGDYFSLKQELQEDEWRLPEREKEEEKRQGPQGLHSRQEKTFRALELQEEEEEEEEKDEGRGHTVLQKEESRKGRSPRLFPEEEEEERKPANQDLEKQQQQEEEQRRKEQLLAKMREIDRETQRGDDPPSAPPTPSSPPPLLPDPKNQPPSPPSFPESVENLHRGLPSQESCSSSSSSSLRKLAPPGRRGLSTQGAVDDLSFGSYAPSFGRPAGRAGPAPPRGGAGGGAEERPRQDADPAKEKKSNLMQQLFGATAPDSGARGEASKMEVLSPPPARRPSQPSGSAFPWDNAKKAPPRRDKSPLQVAESRPAVRAVASFDDDIEEVAL